MIDGVGGRYTAEQRFWSEFKELLEEKWLFDTPRQVVDLPEPVFSVARKIADIYDI